MAASVFSQVGAKGFHSKADVEKYIAAFNEDDFATYFQYYAPEIYLDIDPIPGSKDLKGYYSWAKSHHQIASETLKSKQIVFDHENGVVALESWTEFKGRKGVKMDNFFGWGPVADGIGPTVKMIVFYHLDENGRVKRLQPVASVLIKTADQPPGAQTVEPGPAFDTEDDVKRYIKFFSTNQFDKASLYWAPDVAVHLGPVVISGREENIQFFTEQRQGGMSEEVVPRQITLDSRSCALRADVTFTAEKDFPQGYFGFGTDSGIRRGQTVKNAFVIFYDLDDNRRAKTIKAHRLGEPVIS